MKQSKPFYPFLILFSVFCLSISIQGAWSTELYLNHLVVNTENNFSFYATVKDAVDLQSFTLRLHLPMETIAKLESIQQQDNAAAVYESFEIDSEYDEALKSVVWIVSGKFQQPFSGTTILFKADAQAAAKAGFSDIGIAVASGELQDAFVHGGSIYVLDQSWPWYDLQINYRNAFHRLDLDNNGRVDKKDILFFSSSWHQQFNSDLPMAPTATPTPSGVEPTPTPVPLDKPTIEEFVGTWTFDFLHNTLIGVDVHIVFDAEVNDDGVIIIQDRYANQYLGTYTYAEIDGKISGVFMIADANPLNPAEKTDYFVNFEGEAGIGNSITGTAKFSYNTTDIKVTGYESYGLTLSDSGRFTAIKK